MSVLSCTMEQQVGLATCFDDRTHSDRVKLVGEAVSSLSNPPSAGTKNTVHDEMAAQGDTGEYLHITVLKACLNTLNPSWLEEGFLNTVQCKILCSVLQVHQPLQPPNANFLVLNMPKGGGKSDFVDAVTVAADSINRALQARPELEKANVTKEIVLLSNFHAEVREEGIDDFVNALVESLQSKAVSFLSKGYPSSSLCILKV